MTAKAALCDYLLKGKVLNIKNCFTLIGLTNCPREISRMIEQPFGVTVSRTHQVGKSRYGQPCTWYDYRLNATEYNKEGIEKMRAYLASQNPQEMPHTIPVRAHTRQITKDESINSQHNLFEV